MTEASSRREAILAAAERVFAEVGYDAATMRTIAREAGVGLTLVVYHFETKLNLYREVFLAHQGTNTERRRRVNAVDPAAPDAVEQIVDAFLTITDLSTPVYARLVAREAADPSAAARGIIKELFDPMAVDFITQLERALPDKPAGFHAWAYLFCVGALTATAADERARELMPADRLGDHRACLRAYLIAALRHG
ncbi:TetR/AcrR family transcriptional regulator [Enemella evansiae]|uniref:TetR family transcriptional regulator n=1 Tax=Enemella evansiae TaxID=2016499 RepID=A0A255GKF4_9ACTN|nr:TetR/AcrR family transcriptional regulator [Enemella evansiae]PFG68381.1 TetR family transcriptional regulator [Propionibacteriaceae bacterium ES.041]OYN95578.1 TetR family transcriptional regulator [Enemella evansiae]OYO00327.1 TetR family transcriptional regulator [Enemella evansiae]OYO03683.1 TetR family transcriptional regulator [Enemella evansiae]OYO10109.1 TetR family transcriptional regulator [Enemella evansiae]